MYIILPYDKLTQYVNKIVLAGWQNKSILVRLVLAWLDIDKADDFM